MCPHCIPAEGVDTLGHIYDGVGELITIMDYLYPSISWLHTNLCPYCCLHSTLLPLGALRDWAVFIKGGLICIYSNISWLHTYLCPYFAVYIQSYFRWVC